MAKRHGRGRRWRTVGIAESSAAFDLLSLYAGGPREIERYGAGALIQTDDHTALEYSAPRGIYGRTTSENSAAIRALGGEPPPAVRALARRGDRCRLDVARPDAAQGRCVRAGL